MLEIPKKMDILKCVYKIYSLLHMGIFFAKGYILLDIPKKTKGLYLIREKSCECDK